jgi:hypothetical protein
MGVEQGSQVLFSDYEHDGEMWTGEGERELRTPVVFTEPFEGPPMVHIGLSMWDMDRETNPRVDIAAEKISENGFEIVFRTWGNTRVARVRADWIALGEVTDEEAWEL